MLGLALSGGGYRASLFHLGVMARLADQGLLKHVSIISTVSGGSIIGAFYYSKLYDELKKESQMTDGHYIKLLENLIPEFIGLIQDDMRDRVVYGAGISRIIPVQIIRGLIRLGVGTKILPNLELNYLLQSKLEIVFSNLLFKTAALADLNEIPVNEKNVKPELILNTSILENGKQLFFSTDPNSSLWHENERNHDIRAEDLSSISISKMVAASACVPGIFNPIKIPFRDKVIHAVDGGVLDNLGGHAIQLLRKEGIQILLSDASKPLSSESYENANSVQAFFRIQDIFMDAIRELRLKDEDDITIKLRNGIPGIDAKAAELVTNIRTDLNSFSEVEAYSLMYAGYCACGQETEKIQNKYTDVLDQNEKYNTDWSFMPIRSYMETPTPAFLALLGQKEKSRSLNFSLFQLVSICYLLLYTAGFVYIGINHGFMKAVLYVVLIPVLIFAIGGIALLRLSIKRGRKKGIMSSLVEVAK